MLVLRERRGRVEIITINRPEARNAIDYDTSKALADAFDEVENDPDVWAVVLTGAGDRAFSAGMDLKAFAGGGGNVMGVNGGFAGITRRDFAKPLIAAVNGHAVAGGFEIVLSCDLVVAAADARFGIPEVQRGLAAGAGGLVRLPRRVGLAVALELAMTGDPVDAQTALRLGIVNRVVPGPEVLDTAVALAERICGNAPLATRLSKKIVKSSRDLSEEEAFEMQAAVLAEVFTSPDATEGPRSFAEKREPTWSSV